jgi:hypothetical protein
MCSPPQKLVLVSCFLSAKPLGFGVQRALLPFSLSVFHTADAQLSQQSRRVSLRFMLRHCFRIILACNISGRDLRSIFRTSSTLVMCPAGFLFSALKLLILSCCLARPSPCYLISQKAKSRLSVTPRFSFHHVSSLRTQWSSVSG